MDKDPCEQPLDMGKWILRDRGTDQNFVDERVDECGETSPC